MRLPPGTVGVGLAAVLASAAIGLSGAATAAPNLSARAGVTCAKVWKSAPNGVARSAAAADAFARKGFPRPSVSRRAFAATARLDRDGDGVVCGRRTSLPTTDSARACRLPRAGARSDVEIGFPRISSRLKSAGSVKMTVLFTDFADAPATQSTEQVAATSVPGASAILAQQSFGAFHLVPDLVPLWIRMPGSSSSYGLADGFTFAEHRAYIQDAVRLADPSYDFSTTDLLVVIATPNATAIQSSPAFTASPGGGVVADGREMLNGVTLFADYPNRKDANLAHEIGHTLGLVDLYAFGVPGGDPGLFAYTGYFDIMGNILGAAPELLAWDRWLVGWIGDSQIACNPASGTSVELQSIGTSAGLKAVIVPVSATEAVVAESRTATGLDGAATKSGVLVYTVDTSLATGAGPIRIASLGASPPDLATAPLAPGEQITVHGVTIRVESATGGGHRVTVSHG